MRFSRRSFIKSSSSALAGLGLGTIFMGAQAQMRGAQSQQPVNQDGILELHPDFEFKIVQSKGDIMSDGFPTPSAPDGMACFDLDSKHYVLMRNHEIGSGRRLPKGLADKAYDDRAHGGVTRLVFDKATHELVSSNYVLVGTARNCAGGISPFGWLTCEETFSDGHGYVFLCDPAASSLEVSRRIPNFGRFNHEAAAMDPDTLITYMTEDRQDSCFYRFVPQSPANPWEGQLQALKVVGRPEMDMDQAELGQDYIVDWVDIDEADPYSDSIRHEAARKGAAIFSRGEGLWLEGSSVVFTATSGGPYKKGQIFEFSQDTQGLRILAQAGYHQNKMDYPDNLTIGPQGLIYFCEDGSGRDHIRVVNQAGEISTLARNILSHSELTGVCFDPSGTCMYVNIQKQGLTIRIKGPFDQANFY